LGSATANLLLSDVSTVDGGSYSLLVTNPLGAASSAAATLTVYTVVGGASNLVQDGGFETGDFTSWTLSENDASMWVSTNLLYAHSGRYGAQLGPVGSLGGLLSQQLPTVAGATYLLALWLDSPNGLGPNAFQIGWNASSLFDQVNLGATGWTNLQFIVTASTTNSLLEFGSRDDTSYLGLDDVSVINVTLPGAGPPPPPPQILSQSINRSNRLFSLSWKAREGQSYQLQYSASLTPPVWSNWGAAILATNVVMSASEPLGTNVQRFYRVVLSP
jgi:hypothetical protein